MIDERLFAFFVAIYLGLFSVGVIIVWEVAKWLLFKII